MLSGRPGSGWGIAGLYAAIGALVWVGATYRHSEAPEPIQAPSRAVADEPINSELEEFFGVYTPEADKCSRITEALRKGGIHPNVVQEWDDVCHSHFQTADRHHV